MKIPNANWKQQVKATRSRIAAVAGIFRRIPNAIPNSREINIQCDCDKQEQFRGERIGQYNVYMCSVILVQDTETKNPDRSGNFQLR